MLYALQQRNDPYLEIVDRYDNSHDTGERNIDHFCAAFTWLQEGMAATDADLLGVIYEAYGHSTDAFGQFFTPENLSSAIADMALYDMDGDRYGRDNPLTVADPACGSGRLLVEAAKQVPDDADHIVFYGGDKDPLCAKMTALNLCFFNLDGYAVQGDSLLVEARRLWETRSTYLGGEVRERDPEEVGNPFTTAVPEQGDEQEPPVSEQHDEAVESPEIDPDVDLRQSTFTEYSR